MRIIQIVRRFGPVGGLEGYAWQLARALAARSLAVAVVCETDESEFIKGVAVTALGKMRPKPRWLERRSGSNLLPRIPVGWVGWQTLSGRALIYRNQSF